MTTAPDGRGGSAARPSRLYPLERAGNHCTGGWVGPQDRSGWAENLVLTRIRSRTVQPAVSRYTDWATRPTCPVTLNVLYLIHSIWYNKICTVVRLNENCKITSFVCHYVTFSYQEGKSLTCFNSTFCECATFFWRKCVTNVRTSQYIVSFLNWCI